MINLGHWSISITDETGLYCRMLPEKTLAARTEKEAAGMKKQKERITLMACSNAAGTHKLPLMFVGKAQNLLEEC